MRAAEINLGDLHRGGLANPTYTPYPQPEQQLFKGLAPMIENMNMVVGDPVLPMHTFMPTARCATR